MRRDVISLLACPRTRAPYDVDPVRVAEQEVVEAFLVSRDTREVRPLFAGVAVLPLDLDAHLRSNGSVYKRSPINDPRLARFLLGRAGSGYDTVRFDDVVGHYRDLATNPPADYDTSPHPEDAALSRAFAHCLGDGPRRGRGLVVGCTVGRAAFELCVHTESVLGVDRSIACVRRSRNIAVTTEHFFLPAPRDSGLKEIPIELCGLAREGADFAVADADALPLLAGVFDVVTLFAGDAQGEWADPAVVAQEVLRVARPDAWLLWHDALGSAGAAILPGTIHREGPWCAARAE